MPKASTLNRLSDQDKEAIRHLIRRRELSRLAIAQEAERRLGAKLAPTDAAKTRVIDRYAASAEYTRWLDRWDNQDAALKRDIALQKQRFEYLKSLVQDGDGTGLYSASKHLQARMLTLAAEATDEELRGGDIKWLKSLLKEIREAEAMERRTLGAQAEEIAADTKLTPEQRRAAMRTIFGVKP
jgi:hypothetical protein